MPGPRGSSLRSGIIRLPKNARETLGVELGDQIKVKNKLNKRDINVEVRKVTKNHISYLREMRASIGRRLTSIMIGIVSTDEYNFLNEEPNPAMLLDPSKIKLQVGADPEFLLIDKDNKEVTRADCIEELTYDALQPFGADGPDAEFRPKPATSANGLVKNLTELIKSSSQWVESNFPHLQMICGASYPDVGGERGRPYFIGGHIHVELPDPILDYHNRFDFIAGLVGGLDDLIGLPLIKLDRPGPVIRRKCQYHYGASGDCREKAHGFEWRVPSGIWMASPELAAAVIGSVHAASEELIKMSIDEQLDSSKVAKKFMVTNNRTVRSGIINNSTYEPINSKPKLNKFLNKLKELTAKSKHAEHIENLTEILNQSRTTLNKLPLTFVEEWV